MADRCQNWLREYLVRKSGVGLNVEFGLLVLMNEEHGDRSKMMQRTNRSIHEQREPGNPNFSDSSAWSALTSPERVPRYRTTKQRRYLACTTHTKTRVWDFGSSSHPGTPSRGSQQYGIAF